jgi:hypothetical protein
MARTQDVLSQVLANQDTRSFLPNQKSDNFRDFMSVVKPKNQEPSEVVPVKAKKSEQTELRQDVTTMPNKEDNEIPLSPDLAQLELKVSTNNIVAEFIDDNTVPADIKAKVSTLEDVISGDVILGEDNDQKPFDGEQQIIDPNNLPHVSNLKHVDKCGNDQDGQSALNLAPAQPSEQIDKEKDEVDDNLLEPQVVATVQQAVLIPLDAKTQAPVDGQEQLGALHNVVSVKIPTELSPEETAILPSTAVIQKEVSEVPQAVPVVEQKEPVIELDAAKNEVVAARRPEFDDAKNSDVILEPVKDIKPTTVSAPINNSVKGMASGKNQISEESFVIQKNSDSNTSEFSISHSGKHIEFSLINDKVIEFNSPDLKPFEQISATTLHMKATGKSQIILKLHPEELGQINIRISFAANKQITKIQISADNTRALAELQSTSEQLRLSLSKVVEMQDAKLEFNLHNNNNNSNNAFAQQDQHNHNSDNNFSQYLDGDKQSATIKITKGIRYLDPEDGGSRLNIRV